MSTICPTVTATDNHQYREEIERVSGFANRLHLDFMDADFTGVDSINLAQAWWPETSQVDLHIMFKKPTEHLETIIALKPNLVIVHAESDVDVAKFVHELNAVGIKSGLALLQDSQVSGYTRELELVDHALIFSGHLGHHGGQADPNQLIKVDQIKRINPEIEISWDGGINDSNAKALSQGGVDVLNVGGFIQHAENPKKAYAKLVSLVES